MRHVLDVAVDFDPARGAAASITLKGKTTRVAASGDLEAVLHRLIASLKSAP